LLSSNYGHFRLHRIVYPTLGVVGSRFDDRFVTIDHVSGPVSRDSLIRVGRDITSEPASWTTALRRRASDSARRPVARSIWRVPAISLTLALALVSVVPSVRTYVLRGMGWALVDDDPLVPADTIVITIEGGGAAVLEAADLVHQGLASRVAVFEDPPTDAVDSEFVRRGIPYEDGAARLTRLLKSLGVSNVRQIPRAVAGTEDEGRVLPSWCEEQHLRSVIVVGTADHSRRLRRVLDRAFAGRETRTSVRFARHSTFDPDSWWQSRGGIRTEIIEFEKLLLDLVRHPYL